MSEIITVYITVPSEEKAKEIARTLLEKHLIACSTMFPCNSMYWWDGAIHDDQEFIMFIKTIENKFEAIKQEVTGIHPYKVPCILKIFTEANIPYAEWVQKQVND